MPTLICGFPSDLQRPSVLMNGSLATIQISEEVMLTLDSVETTRCSRLASGHDKLRFDKVLVAPVI